MKERYRHLLPLIVYLKLQKFTHNFEHRGECTKGDLYGGSVGK